jgi:hypothetical protein
MTENAAPDPLEEIARPLEGLAPALGGSTPLSVTLMVVALAAAGGWLHTVYELNRLVSREVVRSDVLRELRVLEQRQRPPAQPQRSRADD